MTPSDTPTRADDSRHPDLPPAPQPFGDHELLTVIVRDGPAVLWAARQRSLDRLVTLKFLNGGSLPTVEQERRLRREAAATARLGHAGVIPIFEVGIANEQPFLSLPRLDGGPLAERLRLGPLPVRVAADVLRQLAETLYDAHQKNVLHGNLSPTHVWIDATNHVRLTGFATDEPPDESTSAAGYLAPEQARGAPITPATDVYGLGAILYAMLTGRPPYQAATIAETLTLIRSGPPVSPSRLNRRAAGDLEVIALRCLRHAPEGPYGAGKGLVRLLADLRRFLGGKPISGKRRTGREALAAGRHLLAPGLVLLLVIGLALWDDSRDAAAWQELARPTSPHAVQFWVLRRCEQRHADAPESSETVTALALALCRVGRLEEAASLIQWEDVGALIHPRPPSPIWRGDRSGWQRTQMLTLALIVLRLGDRGTAQLLEQWSSRSELDAPARPDFDDALRIEVRNGLR